MRYILLFLILVTTSVHTSAQHLPQKKKKKGYYYISVDSGFVEKEPERGAVLNAFYEKDTLIKISCWYGFNFGDLRRDFHYWNDKLIMVTEIQRLYSYTETKPVDFDTIKPNFEGRYLFENGRLTSVKQDGSFSFMDTPADKDSMQNTFIIMSNNYKQLAENERANKKNRKKMKKSKS
ncbi:MAG: hypothetical protein H7Y00_06245 [Fimbriimonadaceae bacterium]|nr:hypothetical protein [Chitinophagales bacterium]